MESHIQIRYSDKLPDAMHLSRDQFEQEAKLAMAVKLFEMGKLSSGMAASLADLDRVTFLLTLEKYNVSMINYDPKELEEDIKNA